MPTTTAAIRTGDIQLDTAGNPVFFQAQNIIWDNQQRHQSVFEREFLEHHLHDSFEWDDEPRNLTLGFTCNCSGNNQSWHVPLTFFHNLETNFRRLFNRVRQARNVHTADRIEAQLAREQEFNLAVKCKKKTIAEKTAYRLLRRHLNRQQRRELEHLDAFRVKDPEGREYWIEKRPHTNVKLVDGNKELAKYCAVFNSIGLPIYDLMLAQKFLIESEPKKFFDVAIRTPIVTDNEIIEQLPGRIRQTRFATATTATNAGSIVFTSNITQTATTNTTITFNTADLVFDDTFDPNTFRAINMSFEGQVHVPDGYELTHREENGQVITELQRVQRRNIEEDTDQQVQNIIAA